MHRSRRRARALPRCERARSREMAFGMNATSFIRPVSLAIGQSSASATRSLSPTSITKRTSPRGSRSERLARVRVVEDARRRPPACRDLEPLLSERTRLSPARLLERARLHRRCASRRGLAHAAGAEIFLDAFTTARTARSTCRRSIATTWSARATRSSRRTWAFCGAATRLTRCRRFARTSSPMSRPARSRPARSSTRTSRAWTPPSATSRSSGVGLPPRACQAGDPRGPCARTFPRRCRPFLLRTVPLAGDVARAG